MLQQAGLLQVGHGDPPAALQVDVEPVLDHLAQRPLGLVLLARTSRPGCCAKSAMVRPSASVTRWATISCVRPSGRPRPARRYSAPRSWVTWTKSLKCPACRLASCRLSTKVSSLRAVGVQLAFRRRLRRLRTIDGDDQRRRRADRPSAVEGGQLGEVAAADLLVGDAAAQAERGTGSGMNAASMPSPRPVSRPVDVHASPARAGTCAPSAGSTVGPASRSVTSSQDSGSRPSAITVLQRLAATAGRR